MKLSSSSSSSSGYTPPPPIAEQKCQRQKDPSIVPPTPYLLASKFLDVSCSSSSLPLTIINRVISLCPPGEDGGWRSTFPWQEMVEYPSGKLSHSFEGYYSECDFVKDVTFDEYSKTMLAQRQQRQGVTASTTKTTRTITESLKSYYGFAFHTHSTTLSNLTHPLTLCIILALLLILRIIKKIFLPKFALLGQRLGSSAHGTDWKNENQDRIVKLVEYFYRLCYHSTVSIFGLWFFWDKSSWWWDTTHLWIGHPNQPREPSLIWYYLVQSAYSIDSLISLIELSIIMEFKNPLLFAYHYLVVPGEEQPKKKTKKTKQKLTPLFQIKWSPTAREDFHEMMAHHLVTCTLIFLSSYYRFMRIGSMILFVHNLSDAPLDMSKLANFVKWKVTTMVCFVIMVVVWFVMRLIIFPLVICKSVFMESYEYLVLKGTWDPALRETTFLIYFSFLGALVCLHITWFVRILRVGWTLVRKGEKHDYNEHNSGDKQKRS